MKLIQIYECFCDETRLRILHLLSRSPLCVSHLQGILQISQVKISKHLSYMKERKMVEASRFENWMIYSLPKKRSSELENNLICLQDCSQEYSIFKEDLSKLKELFETFSQSKIAPVLRALHTKK